MSGRGLTPGRARGARANKVVKPYGAMNRGNRAPGFSTTSLTPEQLEAHIAAAGEEAGDHLDDGENGDGSVHQGDEGEAHDEDMVGGEDGQHDDTGDHQQQPNPDGSYDIESSATAAAHGGLLSNGPSSQQNDADIHPALQGILHHAESAAAAAAAGEAAAAAAAGHHSPPPNPAHSQGTSAMEAPMEATADDRSAMDLAKESGYPDLVVDSALSKRLSGNSGVRLAVQRRSDQELNLKRRSNVEALLAHVSGQETHSPCKSCHKGYGPWNGCVVVNGLMCGSCSNCWFNASGSRCSFHETNLPQQQQHVPAVQITNPNAGPFTTLAPAIPPPTAAPLPPSLQNYGLGQQTSQISIPTAPLVSPGHMDQYVRSIIDQTLVNARSDDHHLRFQMRIDAAARNLSIAIADYNDFLSSPEQQQAAAAQQSFHHHNQQQQAQQQQQQQQQQSPQEAGQQQQGQQQHTPQQQQANLFAGDGQDNGGGPA